jgi:hypothetical protein
VFTVLARISRIDNAIAKGIPLPQTVVLAAIKKLFSLNLLVSLPERRKFLLACCGASAVLLQ